MKIALIVLLSFFISVSCYTQSDAAKEGVTKACLNYIEGFYEGDTLKLIASLKPSLNKFGFWRNKTSGKHELVGYMTFEEAKDYATKVLRDKEFPKADAPKKVVVLDIMNHIAAAKITAWWGTDYLLLSKDGDKWMIEQVIWEGPLER